MIIITFAVNSCENRRERTKRYRSESDRKLKFSASENEKIFRLTTPPLFYFTAPRETEIFAIHLTGSDLVADLIQKRDCQYFNLRWWCQVQRRTNLICVFCVANGNRTNLYVLRLFFPVYPEFTHVALAKILF